jgi:hypothetical protein
MSIFAEIPEASFSFQWMDLVAKCAVDDDASFIFETVHVDLLRKVV